MVGSDMKMLKVVTTDRKMLDVAGLPGVKRTLHARSGLTCQGCRRWEREDSALTRSVLCPLIGCQPLGSPSGEWVNPGTLPLAYPVRELRLRSGSAAYAGPARAL